MVVHVQGVPPPWWWVPSPHPPPLMPCWLLERCVPTLEQTLAAPATTHHHGVCFPHDHAPDRARAPGPCHDHGPVQCLVGAWRRRRAVARLLLRAPTLEAVWGVWRVSVSNTQSTMMMIPMSTPSHPTWMHLAGYCNDMHDGSTCRGCPTRHTWLVPSIASIITALEGLALHGAFTNGVVELYTTRFHQQSLVCGRKKMLVRLRLIVHKARSPVWRLAYLICCQLWI